MMPFQSYKWSNYLKTHYHTFICENTKNRIIIQIISWLIYIVFLSTGHIQWYQYLTMSHHDHKQILELQINIICHSFAEWITSMAHKFLNRHRCVILLQRKFISKPFIGKWKLRQHLLGCKIGKCFQSSKFDLIPKKMPFSTGFYAL